MKYSLFLSVVLLVGLVAPRTAEAQVQPYGDVHFIVGLPQGDVDRHVDDVGFGLAAFGGLGIYDSPLVVGLEIAGMIYGHERRNEPFSTTIPDVTVDVETSNNIVMGHFVLRLQPRTGTMRPYVDGLFGGKYLFTQTQIENERWTDQQPIATSTNFDDSAFSYGLGGGVNVLLYEGMVGADEGERRHMSFNLNVGARYLFGSEAEYLKEGSIRRENGEVSFDVDRSRTDMLVPQLGVKVVF